MKRLVVSTLAGLMLFGGLVAYLPTIASAAESRVTLINPVRVVTYIVNQNTQAFTSTPAIGGQTVMVPRNAVVTSPATGQQTVTHNRHVYRRVIWNDRTVWIRDAHLTQQR